MYATIKAAGYKMRTAKTAGFKSFLSLNFNA